MKNEKNTAASVNKSLESLDNMSRATPMPYLLTRIAARMERTSLSIWEKTGRMILRPSVAFTGIMLILFLNLWVLFIKDAGKQQFPSGQISQGQTDDFSYSIATIYDIENMPAQ